MLKTRMNFVVEKFKKLSLPKECSRFKSDLSMCSLKTPCAEAPSGAIVGVYIYPGGGELKLTKTGQNLNDILVGRIYDGLRQTQPFPSLGQVKIFQGLHPLYTTITVVGLGNECAGYNLKEQLDEKKEAIRTATAAGVLSLNEINFDRILVDSCDHAESAAEGSSMAAYIYQEFKALNKRKKTPRLELFDSCDFTGWQIGMHKAAAQNLARHLQEAPSNHLTPQTFAQLAIELLSKYSINVEVRMKQWAKLRNLNAFLAAGQGACDPVFLEIFYEGCDPDICPVVLIGKGVTFNSGGLCIKSCRQMQHKRGDLAGAACVIATMRAIAALKLPVNVRGLIPLCANVPGARAMKPGDIIRSHSGKTIRIDCTNCEGLLMHADTLSYAGTYNPKFILDIGTMTYDSIAAMGQSATLVYSNNESLYEMMRNASIHTGDRIWRFPLWSYYKNYVIPKTCDFTNDTPWQIGGGSCKAAAFLSEFVPRGCDWLHMDIQNVYRTNGQDFGYLRNGMSGRPTRNLIEFLAQVSCRHKS